MSIATNSRQTQLPVEGDLGYIPTLDGWRAIAIALVVLFHGFYNTAAPSDPIAASISAFSGRLGALGVLVFFCISGYLITLRLIAESRKDGSFSLQDFYIKRAFRILPPLGVYFLFLLALDLAGVIELVPEDATALIFLTNYIPGSWYTTHFWSLSVEEHFYLLWPVSIVFLRWRRAMYLGVAVILAVAVWRPWNLSQAESAARVLQHTDMRLDYIMMGCVVSIATSFHPMAARAMQRMGSPLLCVILVGALGASALIKTIDMRSVQALILTLLVCGTALNNGPLIRLVLCNGPVQFIGKLSYSIYIWQQIVLAPATTPILQDPRSLFLRIPLVLLLAWISYRAVEQPMIAYGRKLLKKKRASRFRANASGLADAGPNSSP